MLVTASACSSPPSEPSTGATPEPAVQEPKVEDEKQPVPENENDDDGTTVPPEPRPLELTGTLVVEGRSIDLAAEALRVVGTHCTDGDGVDVRVMRGEHGRTLWIRAKAGDVPLGEPLTARTTGSSTPTKVDVFADVSAANRGASATLPESATVRFDAFAQGGPIDLTVDASFGAMGQAKGRIRLETTNGEVCTRPPPPPPPP